MKKNILIMCGGKSGEHEISLKSAASVIANLDKKKYNVVPVCISKEGLWLSPKESLAYLKEAFSKNDKKALDDVNEDVFFDVGHALVPLDGQAHKPIDVVFPVLHGPYGEDGTVQGLLELLGIPYVGSDTLASALSMDKVMAKKIFRAEGLTTPDSWVLTRRNKSAVMADITVPCVVKPVNLGSSVGVAMVKTEDVLEDAIDAALKIDRKGEVLVEKMIKGREVTVPILGEEALPVIEIRPLRKGDWFDYEVKYNADLVAEIVPAPISDELTKTVKDLALKAYHALKCRHISRVDIIIEHGTDEPYLLEVNTLPGLTSVSLFPKSAKVAGIEYGELLDRLIEMAINEQ